MYRKQATLICCQSYKKSLIMKTIKTKSSKMTEKTQASEKLERAKSDYEKTMRDIAPFLPRTKIEDVTTAGRWQTTVSLFLC